MAYNVIVQPAAQKQISRLSSDVQRRVVAKLFALADDPRPAGCKKLSRPDDLYRIRIGDYRVIYHIQDRNLIVTIVKVGHRGGVYE